MFVALCNMMTMEYFVSSQRIISVLSLMKWDFTAQDTQRAADYFYTA